MRTAIYLEAAGVTGGIEVFARRHEAELRAAGHEVVRFEKFADFARAEAERPFDEVVVHKCGDAATLERFPADRTVYYVHDHEPICPRTYAYTPFGRNCTRASGILPCIFCAPACRSWKAALGRVLAQRRRKRAMARFKALVVISEFMKRRLVANGLPAARIVVKPPVIDAAKLAAGANAAKPPAAIDLLYVGQLVRGKGVQLLLRALAKTKTRRRLDVVGTGNLEAKLRLLAERLGVRDRVTFHGFQPNPAAFMAAARCVVVPSFWQEPYGLVAAEAVALGRPVVAFAVGGLPEACAGGATLVPPGDVDALARALEEHGL